MNVDLGKLFGSLLIGGLVALFSWSIWKAHEPATQPDGKRDPVAARKLLYFSSASCGPCRKMAGTLTDAKVTKALADTRTLLVKYDVEKDKALVKKYGISRVPTLILLDATEKELKRDFGYRSPSDVAAWITGKANFMPFTEGPFSVLPSARTWPPEGCPCVVEFGECKCGYGCTCGAADTMR